MNNLSSQQGFASALSTKFDGPGDVTAKYEDTKANS
jgi:hypothetical protein